MISLELEVSNELKRLLKHDKLHVDKVLSNGCEDLGREVHMKIQEKGFISRDTGDFAKSHYIESQPNKTYIKSSKTTSNGVPLWIYIVGGHRVLTTERSRRWWFWHLKNVLGGEYTRKTNGGNGYVPPNNYHERAVNAVDIDAILNKIIRELV